MTSSGSFTIDEWCAFRRISRSMYYKLVADGKAPRAHSAGARKLISAQADNEWLEQRESEEAETNRAEASLRA